MVSAWVGAAALAVAVALGIVGGRRLGEGLDRRRERALFRTAERATVADAARDADDAGERRVTGEVRPVVGTLQAPFSGEHAVVADWWVDERGRLPRWRSVADGVDAVPFVVEDDTGRALVWPTSPAFDLQTATGVEVEGDDDAPDPVRRFLARGDAPEAALDTARRYVEGRVAPGDEVTVVGRPRPVESGDPTHEPDATAADGGRPAVSVADADVAVAFGPPWSDHEIDGGPSPGLTRSGDLPPSGGEPRDALIVTDRSPEQLRRRYDDVSRSLLTGAGLTLAALAVAAAGLWVLVG